MNLKREYARINRRYFGNQLPKNVAVRYSTKFMRGRDARSHIHGCLPCPEKGCKKSWIHIDPVYRGREGMTTMHLFHEMTHFRGIREGRWFFDHGKVWNKGMQELAARGAFNDSW